MFTLKHVTEAGVVLSQARGMSIKVQGSEGYIRYMESDDPRPHGAHAVVLYSGADGSSDGLHVHADEALYVMNDSGATVEVIRGPRYGT